MRRMHLTIGLLGVIAFVITGQVMGHHHPRMQSLTPEFRMMYVSRHIYLLGAALVNMTLGLYLQVQPSGWRRVMQQIGSLLILLSVVALLVAFVAEPGLGMAGRGWRSSFGLIGLFAGVMSHLVASLARKSN
jgi:hypothetical protein